MKLSEGVEAAIHCAAMIAGLEGRATLPAAALAEFHDVSPSYLLKHLKALTADGILESVPGPAGGYRLGRSPNRITLLDIVLAVEGREPAFRCQDIRRRGPGALPPSAYLKPCGIHVAMLKAERAYREALAAVRLCDIVAEFAADSDPRSVERGRAYVVSRQRPQS